MNTPDKSDSQLAAVLSRLAKGVEQFEKELRGIRPELNAVIGQHAKSRTAEIGVAVACCYEIPFKVLLAITIQEAGVARFREEVAGAEEPNLAFMDLIESEHPAKGSGDPLNEEERLAIAVVLRAFERNLRAARDEGRYLNDLLEAARGGDDQALLAAVRIERAVLSTPTAAQRLAKAELTNDRGFFVGIRNALKGQARKRWRAYDTTRLMIVALQEAKELDHRSIEELYQLLCKELKVYPDQGSDPARNLHQFIYRFRKKATT